MRSFDLYFPHAGLRTSTKGPGAFELVWTVRAGARGAVTKSTSFERFSSGPPFDRVLPSSVSGHVP